MKYLKGTYLSGFFICRRQFWLAVDFASRCPVVHLHVPTSDFDQCGVAVGKEKKEANT